MKIPRRALAAAALAAALLGARPGEAAATPPFVVKRFLVGTLATDGTDAFIALGGPGSAEVPRQAVLLVVFTAPVALPSVDDRTVRVAVPSANGLEIPVDGSFYRVTEKAFDPSLNAHVPRRTWRNRFLFDPTSRNEPVAAQNPSGFPARAGIRVTLPGGDTGGRKTVRSRKGVPLERGFTATITTADS